MTLIRPDRAMARRAGLHPLALFDGPRARAVYPLAYEQGLHVGAEIVGGTARRARTRTGPAA